MVLDPVQLRKTINNPFGGISFALGLRMLFMIGLLVGKKLSKNSHFSPDSSTMQTLQLQFYKYSD